MNSWTSNIINIEWQKYRNHTKYMTSKTNKTQYGLKKKTIEIIILLAYSKLEFTNPYKWWTMVSVCRWGVVVIKDIMVYFSKKMSVVSETRRDAVGLSSKVENKNWKCFGKWNSQQDTCCLAATGHVPRRYWYLLVRVTVATMRYLIYTWDNKMIRLLGDCREQFPESILTSF